MLLQRQHFLLSYLKTLSVGPAGVWTRDLPLSRPALSQLSKPYLIKTQLNFTSNFLDQNNPKSKLLLVQEWVMLIYIWDFEADQKSNGSVLSGIKTLGFT